VSPRFRVGVFFIAAAGLLILVVWGLNGLPSLGNYRGPYGTEINERAIPERKAVNVVNTVTFDYRGIDTIGEELILFAAAFGVALLLRHEREEEEHTPADHAGDRALPLTSDAVRVVALGFIGPTVILGLYVAAHGHLSPGGGFQGGVVLATAPLFLYLSGRYLTFRRLNPVAMLDLGEGLGAGGFIAIGLLGLVAGGAFLDNFLPLGGPRGLLSGGTLVPINLTVALAVAAGVVIVVFEFLEQTLVVRK
jgi:multicomponent Na+:H+ antiporter subunit B